MQLIELEVTNFRAISSIRLCDLTDVVVLAGPNGCGKSCVLDAIRLFKSAYGSYQQDEWQSWFGEFQVNIDREPQELLSLFQDRARELRIAATLMLTSSEKDYLRRNLENMLEDKLWAQVMPSPRKGRRGIASSLAAKLRLSFSDLPKMRMERRRRTITSSPLTRKR